jgi:hypothetical protein
MLKSWRKITFFECKIIFKGISGYTCPVPAVLNRRPCPGCLAPFSCPDCPVPAVQHLLSFSCDLVLPVLYRLSWQANRSQRTCPGCPVHSVMFRPYYAFFHVLSRLSSLAVLVRMSCPGYLSRLTCPCTLNSALLSLLSCPICPVQDVLSCPRGSPCHIAVLLSLFCLGGPGLFLHGCPESNILTV